MTLRRAVAGIAGAAAMMMLAACGFDAPAVTEHEHNSTQARDFSVGQIRIRDTYVTTVSTSPATTSPTATPTGTGTTTSSGVGTSTSALTAPGGTYLVVSLVNQGTRSDRLTGITTPAGTVTLSGSGVVGGALRVPPKGVPVVVNQPLVTPQGPTALLTASTTPQLGTFIPVQFSFAHAGTSGTESVPIIPPNETTSATSPVPQTQATPPPQTGQLTGD